MLPTSGRYMSGGSYVPEYIRRLLNYPQMDWEYTTWQMIYYCIDPAAAYRATSYHKRKLHSFLQTLRYSTETKNQWARDDPAFVAMLIYFLAVSSLSYAVAFQADGIIEIFKVSL
jgi:hypothetical protein